MYNNIINKKAKISVIGLGYVGLPIALEFAKKVSVIGFDIKPERINQMRQKEDPSNELEAEAFENTDIHFTSNPDELKSASFHIVAVPTPIDDHNLPDLKPLLSATGTVGNVLKKGDYVVFESTVYPGCTEEECIPILEKTSGLKYLFDMKKENGENHDAFIIAVNHDQYINLTEDYFRAICFNDAILVDIKEIFRNKINEMRYWSL